MLCSEFEHLEAYKKEIESGRYVIGKWMEKNGSIALSVGQVR